MKNFDKLMEDHFNMKEKVLKGELNCIIHGVMAELTNTVYHTHLLETKADTLNLEICLNLPSEVARSIINNIADDIVDGKLKLKSHTFINNYCNHSIYVVKCKPVYKDEEHSDVFRLIFPDINGLYPWDDNCEESYKEQMYARDIVLKWGIDRQITMIRKEDAGEDLSINRHYICGVNIYEKTNKSKQLVEFVIIDPNDHGFGFIITKDSICELNYNV